jgi:hypothetical protein
LKSKEASLFPTLDHPTDEDLSLGILMRQEKYDSRMEHPLSLLRQGRNSLVHSSVPHRFGRIDF